MTNGPPALLPEARFVGNLYERIRDRAHINGMGPAPLSWQDLDAFQRVTRTRLNARELRLLGWVDGIWLKDQIEQSKQRAK